MEECGLFGMPISVIMAMECFSPPVVIRSATDATRALLRAGTAHDRRASAADTLCSGAQVKIHSWSKLTLDRKVQSGEV